MMGKKSFVATAVALCGLHFPLSSHGQSLSRDTVDGEKYYICAVQGYACWGHACWNTDVYIQTSEISKKAALNQALKICYEKGNSFCEKKWCQN